MPGFEVQAYFFLSQLLFFAISYTSFGFNSANTLSTMLAIAADSAFESLELGAAVCSLSASAWVAGGSGGCSAAFSSAAATSAICAVIPDPTIDSRICFQFCQAAASSASRCFAPSSISGAFGTIPVSDIIGGVAPLAEAAAAYAAASFVSGIETAAALCSAPSEVAILPITCGWLDGPTAAPAAVATARPASAAAIAA